MPHLKSHDTGVVNILGQLHDCVACVIILDEHSLNAIITNLQIASQKVCKP